MEIAEESKADKAKRELSEDKRERESEFGQVMNEAMTRLRIAMTTKVEIIGNRIVSGILIEAQD